MRVDAMLTVIGFLVNPIAGAGGELAWKGTDSVQEAWKATNYLGSKRTKHRARLAARILVNQAPKSARIVLPEGLMGSDYFRDLVPNTRLLILTKPQVPTTPNDTLEFLETLRMHVDDLDLLIFVGGDGTAALIAHYFAEHDWNVPLIGVPSGVKITSECFLKSPQDLERLLLEWKQNNVIFQEALVTDLDEDQYRQGRVEKHQWGMVIVPHVPRLLQRVKLSSAELHDARESFEEQVELIAEDLRRRGVLKHPLIVGPGSTTREIFKHLGVTKTLLGVDVIVDGKIIIADADCHALTRWFHDLPKEQQLNVRFILTPIGGQGFILGRGNQQICCDILDHVTLKQFIIVATEEKLHQTPRLLIDTDCQQFNQHVNNSHVMVIHGYKRATIRKVEL